MKCNNCGMLNENESKFCSNCGKKINKKSSLFIFIITVLVVMIIGLLLIAIFVIPSVTKSTNNSKQNSDVSNNDYLDEPIPDWMKNHATPIRTSDETDAKNAFKKDEEKYNTKFNIIGYMYQTSEECRRDTNKCVLSYVYASSEKYPQSVFHYCINESKYGCELAQNETAYTNSVKEWEYKKELYEIAGKEGINNQNIYIYVNYVKDGFGAEIVANKNVDIKALEKVLNKFYDKETIKSAYVSIFMTQKGNNSEYKKYAQGIGIADEYAFGRKFGSYKKYVTKDIKSPVKLELKYDSSGDY